MIPIFGQKHNKEYKQRNASYAVVLHQDKVFVVRNAWNDCFLPGGGMKPHEIAEKAVIREIHEECAQHAHIQCSLGEAVQYFLCRKGQYYKMHAYFFCCTFISPSTNIAEHACSWEDVHHVRFLHESHQWAVEHVLNGLRSHVF